MDKEHVLINLLKHALPFIHRKRRIEGVPPNYGILYDKQNPAKKAVSYTIGNDFVISLIVLKHLLLRISFFTSPGPDNHWNQ
ncbi:hypothetical protein J7E95_19760 [Streptomyces sp. ISL-14]|nr:hypothetical protein [Streptomyces sp. ISL-14]